MVVCLERGADLHYGPADATATHCQIGFTFLVLAHLGSPGQRAVKWGVCVITTHQDYGFRWEFLPWRNLLTNNTLIRGS